MMSSMPPFDEGLPWEEEVLDVPDLPDCIAPASGEYGDPQENSIDISTLSRLLDQMVMDIQHLELEVIRARYRLSFFLNPPYDKYLRSEIFSNMGTRYGGDPVYDRYLSYCGMGEYDDAIDTPFHAKRKQRLAAGHDDYPDQYP